MTIFDTYFSMKKNQDINFYKKKNKGHRDNPYDLLLLIHFNAYSKINTKTKVIITRIKVGAKNISIIIYIIFANNGRSNLVFSESLIDVDFISSIIDDHI